MAYHCKLFNLLVSTTRTTRWARGMNVCNVSHIHFTLTVLCTDHNIVYSLL